MTRIITRIRARIAYWRWRRNMRTNVMPLGDGVVACAAGFLAGRPMIVMVPVPDEHRGMPGVDATAEFSFEEMRGVEDLPRGSVVLAFKDRDAVWRHRTMVHKLWAETFKGEEPEA